MALPSNTDMELYCSNKKALLRTVCRSNQWSGINLGNIDDWLQNNFKDIKGKYFAIKILLHGLYYSENNLVDLLADGIYNKILGKWVKAKMVAEDNLHRLKSESEAEVKEELSKTLFIPLLNSNSPGESGNSIIRYLTQKLHINPKNTSFHFSCDLDGLSKFSRIIIVDDCLGSGDQLYRFWNSNDELLKMKVRAQSLNIEIFYLILIGNEDALLDLQLKEDLVGLKVVICEKIGNENRVFNLQNTIWDGDNEEMDEAVKYFDNISTVYDVPHLGYNNMDFAVFIHNTRLVIAYFLERKF
jgi:hypothetical protein